MIVPMKKITLIASSRSLEKTLETLRDLALVHLVEKPTAASSPLTRLAEEREQLRNALAIVRQIVPGNRVPTGDSMNPDELAARIIANRRKHEALTTTLAGHCRERDVLVRIGLSDPAALRALADAGVFVHVNEMDAADFPAGDSSAASLLHVLAREKGRSTVAECSRHARCRLPGHAVQLPERSLTELRAEIGRLEADRSKLDEELQGLATGRDGLATALIENGDQREFELARRTLEFQGDVCHLSGFLPADRVEQLRSAAQINGWALLVREPADADAVPTLLRHGLLSRLFQPVMDFVGVVPGYRELHANVLFLIFFTVFFAMIIGDAGYALLMLLVTVVVGLKCSSVPKPAVALSVVLAVATMIWGALTGVWFGVEELSRNPLFGALVVPGLNAYVAANEHTVMTLCLVLGAGHLLCARLWAAWRCSDLRRWAETGWGCVVIGVCIAAFKLILQQGSWPWAIGFLGVGATLVVLFGEQQAGASFSGGIKRGLINLPLNLLAGVTGFSDVVSYLRLFAVGLATREVATAFNQMAARAGLDSIGGAVGFALIVILGHGVNLLLAAMGVLVHGLRLNLLECGRHLGMTWSGIVYRPFRRLGPIAQGPSLQTTEKGTL